MLVDPFFTILSRAKKTWVWDVRAEISEKKLAVHSAPRIAELLEERFRDVSYEDSSRVMGKPRNKRPRGSETTKNSKFSAHLEISQINSHNSSLQYLVQTLLKNHC